MSNQVGEQNCPHCGRPASGRAGICRHCGARFARFGPVGQRNPWYVLLAIPLFFLGGSLALAGGGCSILLVVSIGGIIATPISLLVTWVGVIVWRWARELAAPRPAQQPPPPPPPPSAPPV